MRILGPGFLLLHCLLLSIIISIVVLCIRGPNTILKFPSFLRIGSITHGQDYSMSIKQSLIYAYESGLTLLMRFGELVDTLH